MPFDEIAPILVVCTANLCRSRYAAELLDRLLPWSARSAGTQADEGAGSCSLVTHRLESGQIAPAVAVGGAQQLRAGHLATATLILTAGRVHRSTVIKMLPDARSRTFTLKEFALLADQFPQVLSSDLGASAARLDRLRTRMVIPRNHQNRGERLVAAFSGDSYRSELTALDVDDGHVQGPARHRRALKDVEVTVDRIVAAFGPAVRAMGPTTGPVVAPPATTIFGRGRHRDGSGDRWHNRRSRGAAGGPGGC